MNLQIDFQIIRVSPVVHPYTLYTPNRLFFWFCFFLVVTICLYYSLRQSTIIITKILPPGVANTRLSQHAWYYSKLQANHIAIQFVYFNRSIHFFLNGAWNILINFGQLLVLDSTNNINFQLLALVFLSQNNIFYVILYQIFDVIYIMWLYQEL